MIYLWSDRYEPSIVEGNALTIAGGYMDGFWLLIILGELGLV